MKNQIKNSDELKEGQCGGCGTFEKVTDSCCEECAKGYPMLTDEEHKEAMEYYRQYVKPRNHGLNTLNKLIGEGGLKRGEMFIIACHNPLRP